jgi:hypothetical protein
VKEHHRVGGVDLGGGHAGPLVVVAHDVGNGSDGPPGRFASQRPGCGLTVPTGGARGAVRTRPVRRPTGRKFLPLLCLGPTPAGCLAIPREREPAGQHRNTGLSSDDAAWTGGRTVPPASVLPSVRGTPPSPPPRPQSLRPIPEWRPA